MIMTKKKAKAKPKTIQDLPELQNDSVAEHLDQSPWQQLWLWQAEGKISL